jgi:hypothetical protein
MKQNFKLLFLFLVFNLLISCNLKIHSTNKKQTSGDLFKTITFGNCEYVQIEYGIGEGRVYRLIHKESCKNHTK